MLPLILNALLLLSPAVTASPIVKLTRRDYPKPEPCSGVCQGKMHDPAVIRRSSDGTYFRFTTNDQIKVATAPDMSGPWTYQCDALSPASIIDNPGNKDIWAPDVSRIDDTYYLYYAVSEIGSQNSDIGVATSASMDCGTWTDHGSIGIPYSDSYNRIDPNLFRHGPRSELLMSFGSYFDNIYQVSVAETAPTVAGSIKHLEQNTTNNGPSEGSYLFQQELDGENYYYLFFSSGACCNSPPSLAPAGDEYKIMVCRSDRPSGGFVDQAGHDCLTQNGGTLVLGSHGDVYAPGGQGVMYDPAQGSVVVYYHYVKPSVGYGYDQFYFGFNKLDFSSGWPVVI